MRMPSETRNPAVAADSAPTTGQLVRDAMKAANVSQQALADKLSLSQGAISRRLTGQVDFSSSELVVAAGILGVHPGKFFDNAPQPASR